MALAQSEAGLRASGRFGDRMLAGLVSKILWVRGGKDIPLSADVEKEWQIQAEKYIGLGFHKELGMSEAEYKSSLPQFESQPEAYIGRFDIPLLVETRIPAERQAELAGISVYYSYSRDWEGDPEGYKTPTVPYTTWVQDGTKNLNKSVGKVRDNLVVDERGGTEFDGIALYIKDPEILEDHALDLPGTSVGSVLVAYLSRWDGEPKLRDHLVGGAGPDLGSVSCGR